jgi:hypothetical protein
VYECSWYNGNRQGKLRFHVVYIDKVVEKDKSDDKERRKLDDDEVDLRMVNQGIKVGESSLT